MGSIPGQGTKIPYASQWSQKLKEKKVILDSYNLNYETTLFQMNVFILCPLIERTLDGLELFP